VPYMCHVSTSTPPPSFWAVWAGEARFMSGGGMAGSQAQIRMAGGGNGEGSYCILGHAGEEVPYQILRHYNACVELWPHMFAFVGPDHWTGRVRIRKKL
jgi:hypothetical protein